MKKRRSVLKSNQSSANKHLVQPIECTLKWKGRRLRILVDTGSSISVIPKSACKKHYKLWPALQKTAIHLSSFLGPLLVWSKMFMKVLLGPVTLSSSLIAVDHRGPPGVWERRDRGISQSQRVPFQERHIVSHNVDSQYTALLEEDCFEDLGCCQGPPDNLEAVLAAPLPTSVPVPHQFFYMAGSQEAKGLPQCVVTLLSEEKRMDPFRGVF
ncbi:hypothetical protein MRX96_039525 [Rhipicephalus microplus]